MNSVERLRLITKVARLYYEHGIRQPQIAKQLSLSQAMVSRLLTAAHKEGIVRTTVTTPTGVYSELEEDLVSRYKLQDATVADCSRDTGEEVLRAIGGAAASYLEATLGPNEVIGISSMERNAPAYRGLNAAPASRREEPRGTDPEGGSATPPLRCMPSVSPSDWRHCSRPSPTTSRRRA